MTYVSGAVLPAARGERGICRGCSAPPREGALRQEGHGGARRALSPVVSCRTSSDQTLCCQGLKSRELDLDRDPLGFDKAQPSATMPNTGKPLWL